MHTIFKLTFGVLEVACKCGGDARICTGDSGSVFIGDATADLVTGGGEWTAGGEGEKLLPVAAEAAAAAAAEAAAAAAADAAVPGFNVGGVVPGLAAGCIVPGRNDGWVPGRNDGWEPGRTGDSVVLGRNVGACVPGRNVGAFSPEIIKIMGFKMWLVNGGENTIISR